MLTELGDRQRATAKVDSFAGRARGGKEPKLAHRKVALRKTAHELNAHGAAGADNGDHKPCAARAGALHELCHALHASAGG